MESSLQFYALAIFLILWLSYRATRTSQLPLPPGPPPMPIIGNLLDIPKKRVWITYAKWKETYGHIISLTALGQTVIVLSSPADVKELLANRAGKYSGRLCLTMVNMLGLGEISPTIPPGDKFRAMRLFLTQILGPHPSRTSHRLSIEDSAVGELIRHLVSARDRPSAMNAQLQRMVMSLILKLTYGYDVETDDDPFIDLADRTFRIFLTVTQPGWAVDLFPFLRHVPSWFPFATFKRQAVQWREVINASRTVPFDWTRRQIESGNYVSSFATELLEDADRMKNQEMFTTVLRDLFVGGEHTTMTLCAKLFLVLGLHPDAQEKAQIELDMITDGTRLPVYGDRPNLPYLEALLKESQRWFTPVVPCPIPHCTTEADEYKGFHIPKGALIFVNVWSIFNDPTKYPEPHIFRPERFLGAQGNDGVNEDPTNYSFGFGSRICPGRHFVDTLVWLLAAKLIATCKVSDLRDARTGHTLTQGNLEFSPDIASIPAPFTCRVTPRTVTAEALLFEEPA